MPDASLNNASESAGGLGGRVISALQEFVQDGKAFRMPSRHSILQWQFEERCVPGHRNGKQSYIEFRATVAFVLEGVPHEALGEWQSSKSLAKRDAAERALVLFVGEWGCQLLQEDQMIKCDPLVDTTTLPQNCRSGDHGNEADASTHALEDVDILMNFCSHFAPCGQTSPELSVFWEELGCKGLVEIIIFGTPHTFAGTTCNNEDEARADVARRVLWYLQCPGFADAFEVDMDALASRSSEIVAPPSPSTGDSGP